MKKEIWKFIKDPRLKGLYKISSLGRVMSFNNYLRKKPKILTPHFNRNRNYCYVSLQYSGYRKNFILHRLVAKYFVKNVSPKKFRYVDHNDFNTKNNKATNLVWCTQSYNIKKDWISGRRKPIVGEDCGMSVLKELDVLKIHKLFKNGVKQKDIASVFKIKPCTVSLILSGKRWGHIKKELKA